MSGWWLDIDTSKISSCFTIIHLWCIFCLHVASSMLPELKFRNHLPASEPSDPTWSPKWRSQKSPLKRSRMYKMSWNHPNFFSQAAKPKASQALQWGCLRVGCYKAIQPYESRDLFQYKRNINGLKYPEMYFLQGWWWIFNQIIVVRDISPRFFGSIWSQMSFPNISAKNSGR